MTLFSVWRSVAMKRRQRGETNDISNMKSSAWRRSKGGAQTVWEIALWRATITIACCMTIIATAQSSMWRQTNVNGANRAAG